MIHFRTSVNCLLAMIAASSLALGAFRVHPALGVFFLGAFCISWVRMRQLESVKGPRAVGTRTTANIVAMITTVATASFVLFASSMPAVILCAFLRVRRVSHLSTVLEPSDFLIVILSSLVGIPAS